MRDGEKVPIVLIAAKEFWLNNISHALADANVELLCAETKHEAIGPLERIMCELDLTVVELALPDVDSWGLIKQLRQGLQKPVTITTTTAVNSPAIPAIPAIVVGAVRELGVYAIVPKATQAEGWWQAS
jgi:CheY-like chemotaxis protein